MCLPHFKAEGKHHEIKRDSGLVLRAFLMESGCEGHDGADPGAPGTVLPQQHRGNIGRLLGHKEDISKSSVSAGKKQQF